MKKIKLIKKIKIKNKVLFYSQRGYDPQVENHCPKGLSNTKISWGLQNSATQ